MPTPAVSNQITSDRIPVALEFATAFVGLYALIGFCTGGIELLHEGGIRLISGATWKAAFVIFIGLLLGSVLLRKRGWVFSKQSSNRGVRLPTLLAGVLALLLVLSSDWLRRRYIFYPDRFPLIFGLTAGLFLTALLALGRRYTSRDSLLWPAVMSTVLLFVGVKFLLYSDGRLIFSDDHPSFLYRLQMLNSQFPRIPFYNTEWNAGYSATEFFATGVLNVYLLALPLLLFSNLETVAGAGTYTALLPYLFCFIAPLSLYFASRVLGLSRRAAALAGVFALGPSMGFFEWLIKYGTLGFCLSAALCPLVVALAYRLAVDPRPPRWVHAFMLALVGLLCVAWGLSSLALVPVLALSLCAPKRLFESGRREKILTFVLTFGLGVAPWFLAYAGENKLGGVMTHNNLPGVHSPEASDAENESAPDATAPVQAVPKVALGELVQKSHRRIKEGMMRVNPLLIVFGALGLFALGDRRKGWAIGFTLLFLLIVTAIGEHYKPQLELKRMLILLGFFLCIPAGAGLSRAAEVFEEPLPGHRKFAMLGLRGVCSIILCGLIALSPQSNLQAYTNQSIERYRFAPDYLEKFSTAIAANAAQGRTLFLGFILHELGSTTRELQDGGHIAPLARFSNSPLYASHFYHKVWGAIDPIPPNYLRRGETGVEEFLDLVNVSSVVTFTIEWAKYCQDRPERYAEVAKFERFRLFRRLQAPRSYVLSGNATVEVSRDKIVVTPTTEEVVLKFRYMPKLQVSSVGAPAQAELSPVHVFDEFSGLKGAEEVSFIRLRVSPSELSKNPQLVISY